MTKYEILLNDLNEKGLKVDEKYHFKSNVLKGLAVNNKIKLSDKLEKESEKLCILAEEMAHCEINNGNLINQKNTGNRKQELKAHKKAVNTLVNIDDILSGVLYLREEANYYTLSEHLGITEEFLHEALLFFKYKYGSYTIKGNYFIKFCPLNVREKYKVLQ